MLYFLKCHWTWFEPYIYVPLVHSYGHRYNTSIDASLIGHQCLISYIAWLKEFWFDWVFCSKCPGRWTWWNDIWRSIRLRFSELVCWHVSFLLNLTLQTFASCHASWIVWGTIHIQLFTYHIYMYMLIHAYLESKQSVFFNLNISVLFCDTMLYRQICSFFLPTPFSFYGKDTTDAKKPAYFP